MADLDAGLAPAHIELADWPDFALGSMQVRPAERAVEMDGERRELQPRVMQVLVALADARPSVVSRDRLIERCWNGITVGDDALNRCILALRHLAQDLTPAPFKIETVARVGHRLVEQGAGAVTAPSAPTDTRRRLAWTALAVSLVVAGGLFAWQGDSLADNPASIAVLPFRSLSAGPPFFAQGLGEEVLGQLAREPAFRVAGRNAATSPSNEADLGKLGRSIGVDYVLDGSVRSEHGRVRVNASLIQARDGARLWTQTYDRNLNDVLAIQTAIGEDVAGHLKRTLVHSTSKGPVVKGEAYALYLNARGLLRSGNPQSGTEAVALLQQAIKVDPGFASAWSSLGEALQLQGRSRGMEEMIAVLPRARAAVRHALQLDPNLAEAHGVLAVLIGDDSKAGIAHLRRAAALDPLSGEGLVWLSTAQHASGEFDAAMASNRRAQAIDPAWPVPVRAFIDLAASAGDRKAAEAEIARGFPDDVLTQRFALGRTAWITGDFSEAVRQWSIVADQPSRWTSPAKKSLADTKFTLGMSKTPPSGPMMASLVHSSSLPPNVWMATPPSAAQWGIRNRSSDAELVYHDVNMVAAKLMLSAGRADELVATFDRPSGLLGIHNRDQIGTCQLDDGVVVAIALRQLGRDREADALLRRSSEIVAATYRGGEVPVWFEAYAAGVWAVQGKKGLALDALERARRRGWVHAGRTDLPRLEDEPAFASLHGEPRFEALRSALARHLAQERAQIARLPS